MKIILPGLIDLHVHFRDPGQTEKEDFFTGTVAALAGGFTTVFDMPNNKVPITTVERLQEKILIAEKKVVCNIGFYFGSLGDNLDEFKKLKNVLCICHSRPDRESGESHNIRTSKKTSSNKTHFLASHVFGLKLYLNETTGNFLIDKTKLEKIFKAWKIMKRPILLHAEDDAIDAVIKIVRKTHQQAHFCHISLRSDLEQIIKAKNAGLHITCGVTPHHLFLTQNDVKKLGAYGRMKPFLKSKKDVDFLWKNLNSIDAIESDHAPHTKAEKESDTPPFGVPGLETTLPLLLTAMNHNLLTINDIIRLCHTGPAKILHLKLHPQDCIGVSTHRYTKVLVGMTKPYTLIPKHLFTKCGWTPFAGKKIYGEIKKVVIDEKTVFENNKVKIKAGKGKIL